MTISPPNFSIPGSTTRDDMEVYCIQTKNPFFTTSVSSYQDWEKTENSKHGRILPSMKDTGET